tara:strand:- start:308 stop:1816 length:1509 start_codon:yes stop_codon:yes gene_type:complete
MAPATVEPNWWSEPLVWAASDCEMKKVLDEALSLLAHDPTILSRIEADQDAVARAKKKVRQADQTLSLPGLCVAEAPACEPDRLSLQQGRPRMAPEMVYVFMVLRGYLGSICDREARDRLMDSTTVQMYLSSRGECFPGWTTILENINGVSNATRSHILDAQLAMIVDEGLDDFSQAILDSTAVEANSAWPTDARILLGLLERAFASSQKLERFGLSNVPSWWMPRWLKRLRTLLFKINNTAGKPRSKGKLKRYYRQFFNNAEKILSHLIGHCAEREPLQEAAAQPPSQQGLLVRLWTRLTEDISDAFDVIHYAEERIFEGTVRPSGEKILSLGDRAAAFIDKGGRVSVIGYKPQLARSGQGFVSALTVPEGNPSDKTQLVPLVQQIQERTGILPQAISADDGYTSRQGRDDLLGAGVEHVCFSGSHGKKLLSEEEWNDPAYVQARRGRSAVESLIFVLKHVFAFARLRRRGRAQVEGELMEKVIAYNFSRMLHVRQHTAAA